jgi:multidrug transporter EmrE-like cation transporter
LDSVIRATSDPDDDAADTQPQQQQQQTQQTQQQQGGAATSSSLGADLEEAMALAEQQASISDRQAAHREALTAAAQCFLLWFAAQYCFNLSLSWTSVTSNTILSSTSSLFTFALSMLFLKEPYSLAKLLSIGLCIGGEQQGGGGGVAATGSLQQQQEEEEQDAWRQHLQEDVLCSGSSNGSGGGSRNSRSPALLFRSLAAAQAAGRLLLQAWRSDAVHAGTSSLPCPASAHQAPPSC